MPVGGLGCGKPWVNLARFHGVFAPNSKYRARVTPAKGGRGAQHAAAGDLDEPTPAERLVAMIWAQRLKRVFSSIDIKTCQACGGATRIIAHIGDPEVIEKILTHLDAKTMEPDSHRSADCSTESAHLRSTTHDSDASVAATVAAGLVAGAS